jgi:hypothetical protein
MVEPPGTPPSQMKALSVVIESAIFTSSEHKYYCTVQLNDDGEKVRPIMIYTSTRDGRIRVGRRPIQSSTSINLTCLSQEGPRSTRAKSTSRPISSNKQKTSLGLKRSMSC